MTAPDVTLLVERWWPLAGGIARKWGTRFPWLTADFESDAGFALWQVAQKFGADPDAEQGGRFAGLVRLAVKWAVIKRIEAERVHNPTAFEELPRHRDADGASLDPLALAVSREPEAGAALEVADDLARVFARAKLTPRQFDVFVRVVGDGENRAEIAAEQGVTRDRISQVEAAALAKLRIAAGA